MTREGAIGNLIHAFRWNDMPKKEALDMAIQALEQEPVLDKIRAEVLEYIDDLDIAYEICGVFDKYKSDKEGD